MTPRWIAALGAAWLLSGCADRSPAPADVIAASLDEIGACRDEGSARRFDAIVREALDQLPFPGMAVAVTKNEELLWVGAYGFANLETRDRVRRSTPFELASVSKMVTATALMQLYEKGAFALDDDVNGFLPFRVRNPLFPDRPITFRMLLAHASSITDNWEQMPYTWGSDSEVPLGTYLASYLVPGGTRYDAALNYGDWAPGTAQAYCNIGFALAGYLVESISGKPFDAYCRDHIFVPLRMHAAWFLADFNLKHDPPAMQYDVDPSTGEYVPYGYAGVPDYPDGQLRTDAVSLARFLISFANGGRIGPHARLLRPETLALMQTPQFPEFGNKGLGVGFFDSGAGMQVGMFGLDYGATTGANVQMADHAGVVFLANGTAWTDADWAALDYMSARLEMEAAGASD